MRAGYASRTAEYNALFRALHSLERAKLFADPLARSFLTWPYNLVAQAAFVPVWRDFVYRFIDKRWPGMRLSIVARTALIDDWINACVQEGVTQMVVLGAGYDTRPYRLPSLRHLSIFEVDHPDTQKAKLRALRSTLSALPDNVRFIGTDFGEHQLMSDMSNAGYKASLRTLILWEGVTNYLTESSVDATLGWCSQAEPESVVIFTYVDSEVLTNPGAFVGTERLFAALATDDEKLTFGLNPASAPLFLELRGLRLEVDLSAADYRRLYLKHAADLIRGHEFYHVARARVVGPGTAEHL